MLSAVPRIAVVIPALNEERFIGRCLASLARLTYPRDAWEVIVVDNGSSDRTLEIAATFSASLNIRTLRHAGLSVSAVRNVGARMSNAERLIFLDADCVVPANWLEISVEKGATRGVVMLGARFQLPPDSSWVARTWWEYEQRDQRTALTYLSAHNLHINRDAFLQLGGFDETLESNEDYELSQRIRATGGQLEDCPDLAVVHLGNAETLTAFFRRERWHGRDVFQVFVRDLQKRHNLRAVAYAVYTLMSILTLGIGVPSALLWNLWSVPAVAVIALVIAPIALSVRAAVSARNIAGSGALAVLFLVYGVARAVALLDGRRPSERKLVKVAAAR